MAGSRNVGDAVCSPAYYFDFSQPCAVVRFGKEPIPQCDAVIFGGGAIGNSIGNVAAATPARIKIAWGLGETRHGRMEASPAPSGFDLYGSRDWGQEGAEWVPCASCMSPLFDMQREALHDSVLYYNLRRPRPSVKGITAEHNEVSFDAAIDFLASGSTVVTNSYHGAYWATLLGRSVVVVDAYSSKLHQFRHRPAYGQQEKASRYPDALAEARDANRAFFARVMDRLTP